MKLREKFLIPTLALVMASMLLSLVISSMSASSALENEVREELVSIVQSQSAFIKH
jgi:hypothetical protein